VFFPQVQNNGAAPSLGFHAEPCQAQPPNKKHERNLLLN